MRMGTDEGVKMMIKTKIVLKDTKNFRILLNLFYEYFFLSLVICFSLFLYLYISVPASKQVPTYLVLITGHLFFYFCIFYLF